MAITISNSYIQTFEQNVRHLAQQGITRLRPYVTEVSRQSEKHNWDRLAASQPRQKTSPRTVSPAGGGGSGAVGSTDGLDWSRRQSLIETWDAGEVIEMEDPVQMLIDPNSASTVNLAMNMRRAVDDIIIAAATGDSRDGAGNPVAFDTANQQVGTGAEVISLDIALATHEIFYKNDIDPDEPKCFVIGPTQQRKLLQLMEVTSGDYQNYKALSTGLLPSWLGFDWIVSTRLQSPGAGEISCFAMTRKGVGLHVARDITAKVGERTDMSFAWQLYTVLSMGAVRVEDEHVVHVRLKDALT